MWGFVFIDFGFEMLTFQILFAYYAMLSFAFKNVPIIPNIIMLLLLSCCMKAIED